jgi:Ca2+/H+ antiporter
MGNALILLFLGAFGVAWTYWADAFVWSSYRMLFRPSPSSKLQRAWVWGLVVITLGLLVGFAVLGIALPPLITLIFESSQEVSISAIAIAIVVTLSLSWLFSLNRYRIRIENFFADDGF